VIVGALELSVLSVRIRRLTRGEAWREKLAGKIGGKNWRENDVKNLSGKIGGKNLVGKNWREKIGGKNLAGKRRYFLELELLLFFVKKHNLFLILFYLLDHSKSFLVLRRLVEWKNVEFL